MKVNSYVILYENSEGDQKYYKVSGPISVTKDTITVYSHHKGVRTFKKGQIKEIDLVQKDG